MQKNEIKRVYANITLPIDIYKNGEMKMIYEEMHIEMEILDQDIDINCNELKEELQEKIQDSNNESIIIFKKDYSFNKKKRLNSTFRKNMKRNSLTKKNYTYTSEDLNSHHFEVR
jgi:hypothetical protein